MMRVGYGVLGRGGGESFVEQQYCYISAVPSSSLGLSASSSF